MFSEEKVTQTRFNISPRNFGKQFPELRQLNSTIFSDFYIKLKMTKSNIIVEIPRIFRSRLGYEINYKIKNSC